jgi:hypothetical protein
LTASGATTNAKQIAYLEGLKSDLAKPGGFSITEFQKLRSGARGTIKGDNALTVTDADRRLGEVVTAFTDDAAAQLPKAAVDRLKIADAFYAKRQDTIKNVFQKVMGTKGAPLPPERATERVFAMGKNRADFNTLSRLWDEADHATQSDIAASFAATLGRNGKGEFEMGRFATDIGKVPKNVREAIFGKQGAADIADLEAIATAKTGSTALFNRSRSGVVDAMKHGAALTPGAIFGYMSGGPFGAVVAPILQEGATAVTQVSKAGRLLRPVKPPVVRPTAVKASPAATFNPNKAAVGATAASGRGLAPLFERPIQLPLAADPEEQRQRRQ